MECPFTSFHKAAMPPGWCDNNDKFKRKTTERRGTYRSGSAIAQVLYNALSAAVHPRNPDTFYLGFPLVYYPASLVSSNIPCRRLWCVWFRYLNPQSLHQSIMSIRHHLPENNRLGLVPLSYAGCTSVALPPATLPVSNVRFRTSNSDLY